VQKLVSVGSKKPARSDPNGPFIHELGSRWSDSNRRPAVYETAALPLSYIGTLAFILGQPVGERQSPRASTTVQDAAAPQTHESPATFALCHRATALLRGPARPLAGAALNQA
jgi:hypothetical protein